jgi:iron complex outermembrane receptor protein
MIGISRKWGYSHLHFSVYDSKIGVIEGERDSLGRFVDSNGKLVPTPILSGRSLQLPFQRVTHEAINWMNNIFIRGRDQLKVNIGFQTNDRREFSEWANVPNLFFHLGTLTYEARYSWAELNGWEPVAGVSGMTQFNRNRGSEFLIPDYDLQDWGTFFYLKKSSERFTFNGGIRADNRLVDINQFLDSGNPSDTIFHSLDRNISAISGALGMTWHMSNNVDLKTNLGRGFRAPNIAELSANGVHEGTFRYEKGSSALLPETSLQLDAELSVHTRSTSITLSTFCNSINNYIYSRNLNDETKLVNGVNYTVYRYVQGNSLLTGFEFFADIHPLDNIHFENGFSYVYGQNEQTHVPLPFIPAAHSHHMLRFEFPSGSKTWKNPYVSASADLVASQNRIDAFETRTPGYALLGLSAGSEVQLSNILSGKLFISINNLANHSYVDHLNRLKYLGIQNPGRDISFGVILRFEGKVKESDSAN